MSYGPAPRQQANWDFRAAGNFIGGGAGSGLVVFAALSGAEGLARAGLFLAGLALVGAGMTCVWLEIGRPLRALHVFFNPRTSWMSRESFTAALLVPVALAAAFGIPACGWLAAALALVFVYCQGRMLCAARGIPAWREPLVVPLIVLTALAEGGGLFFVAGALHRSASAPLLALFGVLLVARGLGWLAWRQKIAATVAPAALAALDAAGRVLQVAGTLLPLALIALAAALGNGIAVDGGIGATAAAPGAALAAAGGLLAAFPGAWIKYTLITRAGFTQGFALPHLPVRGVRT
jgi:phenylacetyl-CoA:acceptor oxidoreductase subunit 2